MTISEQKEKLSEIATQQQMMAANPKHSVWVEASAGTGKTKVLSDRVLRLLLEKVNPAKILCLTYTKAAAVEMNNRIAKRLSSWAVESDEDLCHDLSALLGSKFNKNVSTEIINFARTLFAQLLDAPGGMKIQTIHSFCQDILKRFPLEANISPYFEVMEDRKSKEILQDIQVNLLKKAYDNKNDEIAHSVIYLTENISEFNFPKVMELITENRTKINEFLKANNGQIEVIIPKLEAMLGLKFSMTKDDIKREIFSGINKELTELIADALAYGSPTSQKSSEVLKNIIAKDYNIDLFYDYISVFLTKSFVPRSEKNIATKGAVAHFPEIKEVMILEAVRLSQLMDLFSAYEVLHSTVAMLTIAKKIIDSYNNYKDIYAALDYEDLIIITRNLLENESVADWVLFKLDGGIEHILIDEAQDTSPNQWAIIRALTQEFFAGEGSYENELPRSVFVVGDRKQSIFSFQGADPKEFDKMYQYFQTKSDNFKKIKLDVSFRSTRAVMDCVNTLFDNEIAKKGVLPDDEKINHIPFRIGEAGTVKILPCIYKDKKKNEDDNLEWNVSLKREDSEAPVTVLARKIAENIKDLVENKKISPNGKRIKYGDFMFLVQQRQGIVEPFIRACKDLKVNVSGMDRLKLLEQIAVQDLISLGKFLLLPKDDLSLAEVLKSPLFGLNDDDLFLLCNNRKESLFNSLLTNKKYNEVAEKLKFLLNSVDFIRPFELFNLVLVQLEGRRNFIKRIGYEVDEVLDEFLNLSLIFEQDHIPSLQTFISWIEQDEVVIKKEMEQGDSNSVKIMTAHGSKGLQAPYVILADTTRTKKASHKMSLLWHENGTPLFPTNSENYDEICKTIKQSELNDSIEENRRLLYVALTRAEENLYIAGFSNTEKIGEGSWYQLLFDNIQSNVSSNEDKNCIIYQVDNEINSVADTQEKSSPIYKSYDFASCLSPAPMEDALARPYNPSKDNTDEIEIVASPLEDSGKFYRRGIVIHKLLQYISSISFADQEEASFLFLQKYLDDFSENELNSIVKEVMNLCHTYSHIFTGNSMAEVPIIGEVEGKIISAKIDRLVVTETEIIIVDYKTNRPAAHTLEEVPTAYITQLSAYKKLLEKIYPNKIVRTYLLWTNTCNLMEI